MFPAVPNIEEINKQNMAMFENAMRAFTPFPMAGGLNGTGTKGSNDDTKVKVAELKKNIEAMQKELERLSGNA